MVSAGEIPSWPLTSKWDRVAHMSNAYGPLCKYKDTPKMQAVSMHLFEKLCITHCSKEGKQTAVTVEWPLLWAVQLAINAQWETEAQVRKMEEELKLEKNMQLSAILLTLVLGTRWEGMIINWRPLHAILQSKESINYHRLRSKHVG